MKTKHLLTALSSVVLALGIALAGIWYNAQLPPLEPGTAASGQDAEVLFQEWAGAFPDKGSDVRTIRTTLQWMAITVFCTLAATVLALHHYKPQRELGYFLLYLVILIAWAATVIRLPERGSGMALFLRQGYFSLTVLAPIWLSAALTGIAPRTRQQKSLSLALTAGYVLLSLSTCGAGHRAAGRHGLLHRAAHRGLLPRRPRGAAPPLPLRGNGRPAGAGHSAGA